MVAEGVDVVDVGGESTRPGASAVAPDEEVRRVVPVIEALAGEVRVSIDTAKAAAEHGAGFVAMHCKGTPADMQLDPRYDDVVGEVRQFLERCVTNARAAGVTEVYIDPGIGFGKSVRHNLQLLAALPGLVAPGVPVLVGTSRKSFIGHLGAGGSPDGRVGEVPPLRSEERRVGKEGRSRWSP